jgi:hypothetical protein
MIDSNDDFPAFFRDYQDRIADILDRPLLFVCGAPKSGTTWLQLSLNHHPEIHCGGEGHFTDWLGKPMHDLIAQYNKKISTTNDFIYKDKAFYKQPLVRRDVQFLLRSMIGMVLLTADIKPTARWIGDKTPLYTSNLPFFRLAFPQARFVNIVRDVRDACSSVFHQSQRLYREGLNHRDRQDPDEVVRPFVENWMRVTGLCDKFAKENPGVLHTIRYEDLHQQPEETLRGIFSFLEVDTGDDAVHACMEGGSFEKLSEGRKRGEENRDHFFRKGIVGDWQDTFEARHLAQILALAATRLEKYGYDTSLQVNPKQPAEAV